MVPGSSAPTAMAAFSASGIAASIFARNFWLSSTSGELERFSSAICRSRSARTPRRARTRSAGRCFGSFTMRSTIMSTRCSGSSVAQSASMRAMSPFAGYFSSPARTNSSAFALSPAACSTIACASIAWALPRLETTHAAASSRARG